MKPGTLQKTSNANQTDKVSVVMSVFDKPLDVSATIQSVLEQQGIELELIVVNDGASDDVLRTLEQFDDPRLRIIHQRNMGLTRALIYGCEAATHEFIARVDAGDVMLSGRLRKQAKRMRQSPDVGLLSCWVRTCTDDNVFMYDVRYTAGELQGGVAAMSVNDFKSPVHASVMFRRSFYRKAGGYRPQFYFTQDCDLWARIRSVAGVDVVEEVLQQCVFSASGISGRYCDLQKQLVVLVVKANVIRHQFHSNILSQDVYLQQEEVLLNQADQLRPSTLHEQTVDESEFTAHYFIASVLSHEQPEAAMVYWRKALAVRPWHMISWLKALRCWLRGSA